MVEQLAVLREQLETRKSENAHLQDKIKSFERGGGEGGRGASEVVGDLAMGVSVGCMICVVVFVCVVGFVVWVCVCVCPICIMQYQIYYVCHC